MSLKLTRIGPGFYKYGDGQYEVVRMENGEWYWSRSGKPPDDIYKTKKDASYALEMYLNEPA